jgi:lysophospholipase L1-like esterase
MHVTKILFIGDSITASFGSKHFDEHFIIENKAVSGDSTVETLSRIRKEWFEFKPDFISLCIGTNDFARFRSNDFIIAQIEKIISEIKKFSDSKIILTTIFPTRENKPRPNSRIDKFNALLKINSVKWNTLFFDLNKLMKDETNQLKEEFTDDGLHLTESAYNLWKDELVKMIKK